MTNWFQQCSPRERFLVLGAGLLVLAVLVEILIVGPIFAYREASAHRLAAASALQREVSYGIQALKSRGTPEPGTAADESQPIRTTASALARQIGLAISRMQPEQDGGLNVSFEDADARLMFDWVIRLRQGHDIRVAKALIRGNQRGETVRAQFLLVRKGAGS